MKSKSEDEGIDWYVLWDGYLIVHISECFVCTEGETRSL
jgi:hypothetical protein